MGKELVSLLYPGHDAVVATHVNKENISGEAQYHNHILVCAYNKEGNRKIQYNLKEINRARYESDQICLEHGQSILKTNNKALSYGEWKSTNVDNNSWKANLRSAIEQEKSNTDNWMSYKVKMRMRGYDIKENSKSVIYIILDNQRKIRDRTLGEAYTKTALEQYWSVYEKEVIETTQKTIDEAVIWKMVNVSKIKMPKIENRKYKLWVSYYDLWGRKRSMLELLLIIWLKTIFFLLLLLKDLFQYREMIYQELCLEYNKTLNILKKIRSYGITSKDELKQEMNTTGSEISHIKKQIKEIEGKLERESSFEHNTNRTDRVALLTELEILQQKLKKKNRIYADLSKIKNVIEKAENPDYLLGC
jgi:copper chaperone CopZ